jgi:hypothetical protein
VIERVEERRAAERPSPRDLASSLGRCRSIEIATHRLTLTLTLAFPEPSVGCLFDSFLAQRGEGGLI